MSELYTDCPRCDHIRVRFSICGEHQTVVAPDSYFEVMGVCSNCSDASIFVVAGLAGVTLTPMQHMNDHRYRERFALVGLVQPPRTGVRKSPDHTTPEIAAAFNEGAVCYAEGCYTASVVMFRKALDLATRDRLPAAPHTGLKTGTRKLLGQRLEWLFNNQRLPLDLQRLADCILEDGNDGAHGPKLTKIEAGDVLDFTEALLERLFTEPGRIEEAQERRRLRRL